MDFWFQSRAGLRLHGCRWEPEGPVHGVVQIVHGIAEYAQRYENLAKFLNAQGYLVVAEDHMGHGQSISEQCPQGYFQGGWQMGVDNTYQVLKETMAEFPGKPYILLGHSMGSFMTRTILAKYPESGITAAIICGTGWQNAPAMAGGRMAAALVCRTQGERTPSKFLQDMAFGSYNRRVEHPRTESDWVNRDNRAVDAYIADPLCGFIPTAGLMRELVRGVSYIQDKENLARMKKDLPVLFIAGGDDPVGNYGAGVEKTARAFRKAGMEHVDMRIYPLCRHELLNEINKADVYRDVAKWIANVIN